jgi:hypothetical protein
MPPSNPQRLKEFYAINEEKEDYSMNDDPHHAHCYNRPSSWQGSLPVENSRIEMVSRAMPLAMEFAYNQPCVQVEEAESKGNHSCQRVHSVCEPAKR